jgi:hypothetical protein
VQHKSINESAAFSAIGFAFLWRVSIVFESHSVFDLTQMRSFNSAFIANAAASPHVSSLMEISKHAGLRFG